MQLIVGRQTSFHACDLPSVVLEQVMGRLTFPNPAYQEAEKRGFFTGNIPQFIWGYEFTGGQIIVPQGFTRQLLMIFRKAGISYQVNDRRRILTEVDFTFQGELKNFQQEAVRAMSARDFGVLAAPTGSGKTVMVLALIAMRRQPALVVVHTKELLEQWIERIGTFLGIPASDVGVIGNGKKRVGDKVTVALVQSLYKCAREVVPHIGHLVVDECHRAPSRTFTVTVSAFDCRFMTGLSATPWRRDGLARLIWWHLGDLVFEVDRAALQNTGQVLRAEVVWRETDFESSFDASTEYSRMLSELTRDSERNELIVGDIAQEASNGGGVCLVLSDRKNHVKDLEQRLAQKGIESAILIGDMTSSERRAVVEALGIGQVKVLLATAQLVGEGFDCPELSTLFLSTPIRFDGRLLQCLGRVLLPAPGKDRARVYDYCDTQVGVLEHSARVRRQVYEGN
ncbi:MAG: DEAD/DEAH box helicase [Deltaproteobacteria bacterium]|nr:DEAD/DEAH box helicase [Deltaproteobacteria bacterium]